MHVFRPLSALVALALLSSPASAGRGTKEVVLSAWDQVAAPGSVTLKAKLERSGFGKEPPPTSPGARRIWRRDIEGRTLRFSYQGEVLGEAVTDDDGTAAVEWAPPGPGEYDVDVTFAGDDKFAPGADSLRCAVRGTTRPLVILDIDSTLSHTSWRNVMRGSTDDPVLEHSPAVVARLAAEYDVVYVTARPDKFLDVTKRWLARWGFPRNPVYLLSWKKYPTYDEAKYKTETLAGIKASFPNMVLGVGDKETDAEAYRAHGLRTLILGDTGGVAGAEPVADWHEIESLLFSGAIARFGTLHAAGVWR